jgi:hypothetical protein
MSRHALDGQISGRFHTVTAIPDSHSVCVLEIGNPRIGRCRVFLRKTEQEYVIPHRINIEQPIFFGVKSTDCKLGHTAIRDAHVEVALAMPSSMFGKLLKFTEQTNPSEIIETHREATNAHRDATSNVIMLLTSSRPEWTISYVILK